MTQNNKPYDVDPNNPDKHDDRDIENLSYAGGLRNEDGENDIAKDEYNKDVAKRTRAEDSYASDDDSEAPEGYNEES